MECNRKWNVALVILHTMITKATVLLGHESY